MVTVLYNVCGAWRSVRLEAANATNIFFSSKLTEPRANQQGKRVRVFRKYKLLIFVQITQLLIR
jgi:hypothetical protein